MKKTIALLLALALLVFPLTGCKKKDSDKPTPVILIPGILGSVLENESGHAVWPPHIGNGALGMISAISDLMSLQLPADAASDGVLAPVRNAMSDYTEGDEIGTLGTYTTLAVAFAEELGSENVFFFGYDWRLDNSENADALAEYIASVLKTTGAKKVDLVAHSMGGLLTSAYLQKHKAEGKIHRVATVGTPFLGAQQAADTLQGKGGGFFDNTDFSEYVGALSPMFESMPSLYELMPPSGWDELSLLANGTLPDTASAAQKKAYAFKQTVIDDLAAVWDGVDHVNLAGTDYHTNAPEGDANGDGTVAFSSATADGLFEGFTSVYSLSHVELVTDKAPVDALVAAMRE